MSPEIRKQRHRFYTAAAVAVVAIMCAIGAALWAISSNSEDAASAQELAAQVSDESLRNCIRNNILSATFVFAIQRTDPDDTPKERRENEKLVANLYPVLSCRQSQEGGRSVKLSPTEKEKYVDLVAKGRAPIVNRDGRVAGSSESLLENIDRLERGG